MGMGFKPFPLLEPLSDNPTKEEVRQKYCNYVFKLADVCGLRVLPEGQKRRWWQFRCIEHPMNKWRELEEKNG